jgi:hypothetical protein
MAAVVAVEEQARVLLLRHRVVVEPTRL